MKRAIIHADMDAFYASVEQMDDPSLRGKPVIVGGSVESRGVVAAASYEARRFGVHSAMPTARAKRLCPQGIFLPGRMERYQEISDIIREIFFRFTPLVEPLSLDEAFLDVTGSERLFGPPASIGRQIKELVREETGLTVSVGVAPNMFLAKLASGFRKPDGFLEIRDEEKLDFLAPLDVTAIWGVGAATAKVLAEYGIRTVADLRKVPLDVLSRRFGTQAETLLELAHGEDSREVVPDADAKSIGSESTYPVDVDDFDVMETTLWGHAEDVGARLRAQGLCGRTVTLKVKLADFTLTTRSRSLDAPTCRTDLIAKTVCSLLHQHEQLPGRTVRLVGLSVSHLTAHPERQLLLFEDERESRRRNDLDRTVDKIRSRMGDKSIRRGRLM